MFQEVEEADARIIPHAIHAIRSGIQRIVVLYGDNDEFVLLMFYILKAYENVGVGDSTRNMLVHVLATIIGK